MIDFTEVKLHSLVLHQVGNKHQDDSYTLAEALYPLEDEDLVDTLQDFFLNSFKLEDIYQFSHHSDLLSNDIYGSCQAVFKDSKKLYEHSIKIAKHLYEQSDHPKIKSGELYVAYMNDCLIDDELVDAIGIFKSENKHTFLKFTNDLAIKMEEGINIKKLDKGTIIFNAYEEEGFRVLTIDMNSTEAQYWRDDFLGISPVANHTFHTKTQLSLCKDFCKKVYSKEEDKKDQVLFLNKSIEYFENNDTFKFDDFAKEVIDNEDYAEKFKEHQEKYTEKRGFEMEDDFVISKPALKTMKRKFRNLIKLDTKIEIKVNPNPDDPNSGHKYLEKGFDEEKKMYFYKVYFREEV